MTLSQIQSQLAEFIASRFPTVARPIDAATPLTDGGDIDSLGILEIVTFIAETFEVEIADDDFLPEHFETLGSLARLVHGKVDAG
ncbi:MAG: acyl carrier protein [Burkholderiaceae bacterium]